MGMCWLDALYYLAGDMIRTTVFYVSCGGDSYCESRPYDGRCNRYDRALR